MSEKNKGAPRKRGRPSLSVSARQGIAAGNDVFTGRPLKVCEIVALEIVRDIVSERLMPGDQLIDEAKMLARYRTSRASLREALRLLEVQGLISIRAGRGASTVVGTPHSSNLGRTMMLYLHMMGANYDQLMEAWARTDPLLAQMAAENPDRELVRRRLEPFLIGEGCDHRTHSVSEGLDFHQIVAELSGNPVLALALSAIGGMHTPHLLSATQATELEAPLAHDHSHVAEAIIAGDGERARKLMADHVQHIIDRFRAYWPRLVGEPIEWR